MSSGAAVGRLRYAHDDARLRRRGYEVRSVPSRGGRRSTAIAVGRTQTTSERSAVTPAGSAICETRPRLGSRLLYINVAALDEFSASPLVTPSAVGLT